MNDLEKNFLNAKKEFISGRYDNACKIVKDIHPEIIKQTTIRTHGTKTDASYSIIIVTYQESEDFYSLLNLLSKYQEKPGFEIIIVNNIGIDIADKISNHLSNFKYLNPGFNYGCSGGRDVGAHYANGDYILFIDDDGILGENAVENMISCIESTNALTCRGKVVPKTADSIAGGNYHKGEAVTLSIPDAEGISIWRRKEFLEFGGFDPLLSGHEGLNLCLKMYPFHGPQAFIYTPNAILFHDYASSAYHDKKKQQLHVNNRKYLKHLDFGFTELADSFREARLKTLFIRSNILAKQHLCKHNHSDTPKLTVITTAKNGEKFIPDYVRSLENQTYKNLHIVFVDDGSSDRTIEELKRLWKNTQNLTLIDSKPIGRSAALNLALEHAKTDLCVIADVDDISLPNRFSDTVSYFNNNPSSCCLSFYCFNEQNVIRGPKPFYPFPVSIKDKALTGMPASFPTFAFKISSFKQKFDESLPAGVDCDWIYRNILSGIPDGHLIPIPMVYYRIHEGQITTNKRNLQKEVALSSIISLHNTLLEGSAAHPTKIELLSGWTPILDDEHINSVYSYLQELLVAVESPSLPLGDAPKESLLFAWHLVLYEAKKHLLKTKNSTHQKALQKEKTLPLYLAVKPSYGFMSWRKIFIPFILYFVKILGNKNDVVAYKKDPLRYLASLESPAYVKVRRLFFPQ